MELFSNTILAILDKIMDMNTGKFKKLCKIWMQKLNRKFINIKPGINDL